MDARRASTVDGEEENQYLSLRKSGSEHFYVWDACMHVHVCTSVCINLLRWP
jgi:hypothetical protein